ncbi:MAG: hypothetical protein ACE5HA_00115 [Anaerolineae bacterium]
MSGWRNRFLRGAVGGMLGGVVMAVFSMSVSLLQGPGLWMPVKLIGGFVLGLRAINSVGAFDLTPIVSGLVIHMVVSAGLGGLFGLLVVSLPDVTLALYGVVYALAIWFLALFIVLPVVDPLLVNNANPVLFAASHITYGAILGWWVGTHV